ncbi:hypothetical protein B0T24DRAFT_161814 [Lasiosphaeria ovina]|uniref:Uncharacterized protein n=1 Tax=Lasiosphaeria ovina TaxID=92902 RepID=A0AAE0NDM5_9PEZI|nr:hypothetical protein B0T24DRAFT_161814 [Lasiosphaeria ovina]
MPPTLPWVRSTYIQYLALGGTLAVSLWHAGSRLASPKASLCHPIDPSFPSGVSLLFIIFHFLPSGECQRRRPIRVPIAHSRPPPST